MTIASTRTHEFNIAELCRFGWMKAGLVNMHQSLSTQQLALAQDFLQLIVDSADTEGMLARQVEFEEVELESAVSTYDLSVNTLDVTATAMYIAPDQTEVELPVNPMSRDRWQSLTAKEASGVPTLYYVHRTESRLTVRFWPTPGTNQEDGTVRFQSQRLRADVAGVASTLTPDFERFWNQYLATKLGAEIARSQSLSLSKVQELESMAQLELKKCKAKGNQHVPQQFVVHHGRRR